MTLFRISKRYINGEQIQIQHTFREGNNMANFFTNWCFNFTGTQRISTFLEPPREVSSKLTLDKQKVQQMRLKRLIKRTSN